MKNIKNCNWCFGEYDTDQSDIENPKQTQGVPMKFAILYNDKETELTAKDISSPESLKTAIAEAMNNKREDDKELKNILAQIDTLIREFNDTQKKIYIDGNINDPRFANLADLENRIKLMIIVAKKLAPQGSRSLMRQFSTLTKNIQKTLDFLKIHCKF
jgi:methionine synthase II (cobalamin-independent)